MERHELRELRVGISLLHLGNRSGTGFYTEQLLRTLAVPGETNVRTSALCSDFLPPASAGRCEVRQTSPLRLRWPFRSGANFLTGGLLADLDVVHYPTGVGPPQTRVPIVATLHDVSPFLMPDAVPRKRRVYLRRVFSAVVKRARVVITDTHWQARKIVEVFPRAEERVRVVYPAVDPIYGRPNLEAVAKSSPPAEMERPYVLSVGTLEPRKNLVTLLEDWSRSGVDADLRLVGRWGWMWEPILEKLDSIGKRRSALPEDAEVPDVWEVPDGRRVWRYDYVPPNELVGFYRNASCLVSASHFEGFCLPILEATRSGVPVLTRRDSAMEEVAGKAGWYYEVGNPNDFGETFEKIRSDRVERENRVELGLRRASLFSDEAFREGLVDAYTAAASAPLPRS